MIFPRMRLLLILLVLVAAGLACNLPPRGPTPPPTQLPMTKEEIQQLEDSVKSTLASSGPSEVTLTITQQQLNAYIAAEMANQPDQPISNPQVVLTNGQMQVFGTVEQAGITVNTQAVLVPRIGPDGQPELEVESIVVGPFPVPDTMKSQVQTLVDRALNKYLSSNGDNFKATSITISEGLMTVTGVTK